MFLMRVLMGLPLSFSNTCSISVSNPTLSHLYCWNTPLISHLSWYGDELVGSSYTFTKFSSQRSIKLTLKKSIRISIPHSKLPLMTQINFKDSLLMDSCYENYFQVQDVFHDSIKPWFHYCGFTLRHPYSSPLLAMIDCFMNWTKKCRLYRPKSETI